MFSSQMISTAVACNLKCTYCYYVTGSSSYSSTTIQASGYESWFARCRIAGIPLLAAEITGGEPLLRSDIGDILHVVAGAFDSHALLTNGVLMTDEIARLLAELDYSVHVSIDHVSPQVSDTVRGGTKGALRGLRRLQEAGVKDIRVAMVVTSANWRDIAAVHQYSDEAGFELELLPVGIHSSHHLSLTQLSPSDKASLVGMARAVYPDPGGYGSSFESAVITGRLPRLRQCAFVETSIFVEADGTIWPCGHQMEASHQLGTIFELPQPILESHARATAQRRPPACASLHCLPLSC